ncbi:three-Cys-motif partner protein TcmP [Paralysiella testudinis]|uniref:Three-Cys-motif partner protein TcmP n=1 Tax=Paralysiella testudinis TaxID=2809020 RepID=A0A892ZF29_9NEIS|nr:three-Cys-motif partner protein TcmP [Paralysiella testudinis]QRQ81098.1 three-Cys-motif partner protein TcmP [Paralysiella testudinis]
MEEENMGELVKAPDGLPAEIVGEWAKEKHDCLNRYIDISRGVRKKFVGEDGAGATYIDPFCGPGLCKIKNTNEYIDGGAVAAWKKSVAGGAPFSQVLIGDLDKERLAAAEQRLRTLGAPVKIYQGSATETIKTIVNSLNAYALHFAFLDPYNLETLDFNIIETLSALKRIDMLVHISKMDLQRNGAKYISKEEHSSLDSFIPGWRQRIDVARGNQVQREQVFECWKDLIESTGVYSSSDVRLITGSKNQHLYWLLLAAKNDLALKFWKTAVDTGQGSLF